MNWMTNFILALLTTSIAGTVGILVWRFFNAVTGNKIRARWNRIWLCCCLFLYMFPIEIIQNYQEAMRNPSTYNLLAVNSLTPKVYDICRILILFWGIGCILRIFSIILGFFWTKRQVMLSKPVFDQNTLLALENAKRVVGVKRNIKICINETIPSPCCAGFFKPTIMLTDTDLTFEETCGILVHELVHLKRCDLLLKFVMAIVTCFHCFNPIIYLMQSWLDKWIEFSCDEKAITTAKPICSKKAYFSSIMDIMDHYEQKMKLSALKKNKLMQLSFCEKETMIEKRINRMKNYKQPMKWAKYIIAASAAVVIGYGSMVSLASGDQLSQAYEHWLGSNPAPSVQVLSTADNVALEEYVDYDFEITSAKEIYVDWSVESATQGLADRSATQLFWSLGPKDIFTTSSFYKSSGSTVQVDASIQPTDKAARVGVIAPDGTRTYVVGTGILSHKFELKQSGYWRVFVENVNSISTIDVALTIWK